MMSNTQKRSAGGNSLNKTTLSVLRGATAGQDLYANEAGDIAPSNWFTGTPVFLDNTDNGAVQTYSHKVVAGDVCSYDADTVFVAYVIFDDVGLSSQVVLKKVNPITGELLASMAISTPAALPGITDVNAQNYYYVQVVPISFNVCSIVLHCHKASNSSHNCISAKFTVSGFTFTNGGWSGAVSTTGAIQEVRMVYFSGVTGTVNRWAYLIRPVTATTAVAYLYKHSSNTITAVTLSFTSTQAMNRTLWAIREGTDDLIGLMADDVNAVVVRSISGPAATVANSNALNMSGVGFSILGVLSTSSVQLQIFGTIAQIGQKYPLRAHSATISSDMSTLSLGVSTTLPVTKQLAGQVPYPVAYAAGQYVFSQYSSYRGMLQPPSSNVTAASYENVGAMWYVKGTPTLISNAVADITVGSLPAGAKIEEANWQPVATKRLRAIYCGYYRGVGAPSGVGDKVDKGPIIADLPWLFMPDLVYSSSKNALAYVGSAVSAIVGANASGPVLLSLQAVKLNNLLTPAKTIKNGVLALTSNWGVKLPPGQRNDAVFDSAIVAVDVTYTPIGGVQGNAMLSTAWQGSALYLENQKGSVTTFTQARSEGNPSAGTSVFTVAAYIDGKLITMSLNRANVNSGSTSLRSDFTFNDHLFFTHTNGHDTSYSDNGPAVRQVASRVITNKTEAKYYE